MEREWRGRRLWVEEGSTAGGQVSHQAALASVSHVDLGIVLKHGRTQPSRLIDRQSLRWVPA